MLQRVTIAGIIAVVASCNDMTKCGGSPCACMLESFTYSMRATQESIPIQRQLARAVHKQGPVPAESPSLAAARLCWGTIRLCNILPACIRLPCICTSLAVLRLQEVLCCRGVILQPPGRQRPHERCLQTEASHEVTMRLACS